MADTALDDSNAGLEPCGKVERWQIRRWMTPMPVWSHGSRPASSCILKQALKRCLSQN